MKYTTREGQVYYRFLKRHNRDITALDRRLARAKRSGESNFDTELPTNLGYQKTDQGRVWTIY